MKTAYWAGSAVGMLRHTTYVINRLAIALQPAQSVVRVIDDSSPRMRVEWHNPDNEEGTSYTDFRDGRIVINPQPVLDRNIDDAIDVVTGFAVHEAGHAQHSRDVHDQLKDILTGSPAEVQVKGYLLNLAEDTRIERAVINDWPGFRGYIDRAVEWLWQQASRRLPADEKTVQNRLKIAFIGARFPDKHDHLPEKFQAELAWWDAWQDDYASGRVGIVDTIERGVARIGIDRETQEYAKQGVDILRGVPAACGAREGAGGPAPIDRYTARQAATLAAQEMKEVCTAFVHANVDHAPSIRVLRPPESERSRAQYVGKPDAMSEALRAALAFRSVAPEYSLKAQRSGEMDDAELYRAGMGDYRVWTQHVVEGRPDVAVGMLVDMSGSMESSVGKGNGDTRLAVAQRMAQLLTWAMDGVDGVAPRVWGHTGDGSQSGCDIYRIWEPGDPMSRLGLISDLEHSNNYDGYAIEHCVRELAAMEQPQKLLIVLSDGLPSAQDYSGSAARKHVRTVTDWAAHRMGVDVIQVAVDAYLRNQQADMFGEGNFVAFTDEAQVTRDLARLLERYTR